MMSEKSNWTTTLRVLFTIICGLLLLVVVTVFVLLVHSKFNLTVFSEQASQISTNRGILQLTQAIQTICLFIFPPFLYAWISKLNPSVSLFFRTPTARQVLLSITSIIVAIPLINWLAVWNGSLHLPDNLSSLENWMRQSEDKATELTKVMLSGSTLADLLMGLLLVSLLAGFAEEVFFRGFLLRYFTGLFNRKHDSSTDYPDWVMHVGIWTIAFLFSAFHLQFFGFFPRLLLGAWFGYLIWWTGSIWIPVIAHITNNALSTIAFFLMENKLIQTDPDQIGLHDSAWLNGLSILLLAVLTHQFLHNRRQTNKF
jgi:uncharacterized protein